MNEEEVKLESDHAKAMEIQAIKAISWTKVFLVLNAFLLFIVIIIVIVLEVQVQTRNQDIETVKQVQNETKIVVQQSADSSARAEKAINDAIKQSQVSSGVNSQFTKDIQTGLAQINQNKMTLDQIKVFLEQLKGP